MSLADPVRPMSKKLDAYQKWLMLFPANWAQLAFDADWRTNRLKTISSNQGTRHLCFGMFIFLLGYMVLAISIGGLFRSGATTDFQSRIGMLTLFANMIFVFVFQSVYCLATEFQRILLQIIDRLESQGATYD